MGLGDGRAGLCWRKLLQALSASTASRPGRCCRPRRKQRTAISGPLPALSRTTPRPHTNSRPLYPLFPLYSVMAEGGQTGSHPLPTLWRRSEPWSAVAAAARSSRRRRTSSSQILPPQLLLPQPPDPAAAAATAVTAAARSCRRRRKIQPPRRRIYWKELGG
jgi:hypothetical protein